MGFKSQVRVEREKFKRKQEPKAQKGLSKARSNKKQRGLNIK